jgi:hypothetical protein
VSGNCSLGLPSCSGAVLLTMPARSAFECLPVGEEQGASASASHSCRERLQAKIRASPEGRRRCTLPKTGALQPAPYCPSSNCLAYLQATMILGRASQCVTAPSTRQQQKQLVASVGALSQHVCASAAQQIARPASILSAEASPAPAARRSVISRSSTAPAAAPAGWVPAPFALDLRI